LADRTIIQAGELVVIGKKAYIGPCCLVMDRNHHGLGKDPEIMEAVYIGERAHIGECSVVLSGSVVRKGQVVPAFSIVTSRGIISAPSPYDSRLISTEYERSLRYKMAYLEPAQDVPQNQAQSGSRASVAYPGAGVVDMRSIRVCGRLENIMIARHNCVFYRRPWGAPLLVATGSHTIMLGGDSFVHHSTQFHATGGSIRVGECNIISWRIAVLTRVEGYESGDVTVEDQCWISANSIILPGTHIGRGSVIGAGSVVHGTFPPWSIIAGHPAEVKGTIEPFEGPHGCHDHARIFEPLP